jgi:hypothetical protein
VQTLEYIRLLKHIVKDLRVVDLMGFLDGFLAPGTNIVVQQPTKNQFNELLFSSRSGYDVLTRDPETNKILKSLNIGATYDSARLGSLVILFNSVGNSTQLAANPQLAIFYNLLESLKNLEISCSTLLETEKFGNENTPEERLNLQIVDFDGKGIDAVRLREIIGHLIQLHTDFARVFGISNDRLRFVVFDSGSDVGIWIHCAKDILDAIGILMSQWWSKVRFWSHDTFEKNMESLKTGLTAMESVQQSVDKKVIDSETGEIIKTRILMQVSDLTKLGVSHPSDVGERINNRELLIEHRDTKLLGAGDSLSPASQVLPSPPKFS